MTVSAYINKVYCNDFTDLVIPNLCEPIHCPKPDCNIIVSAFDCSNIQITEI